MKKQLLILASMLCFSLGTMAQSVYTEPFNGTTVPAGWGANTSSTPPTYSALTANNKLIITMTDSNGPHQIVGTSAPNKYDNFYYAPGSAFNMSTGCKCVTFDIDNTGNKIISFYLQASDISQGAGSPPQYNHFTDNTFVTIPAGYVGPVIVNFSGKFLNGGSTKVDSTQIKSIDLQPVGKDLGANPWHAKFKGNFSIDNFIICGPVAPKIDVTNNSVDVVSAGTVTFPSVTVGSTGVADTIIIENKGAAALSITNIVKSGTDASMFTIGNLPSTYPASISAASIVKLPVTFSPTSSGAKTAVITISSSDATQGTYVINLSATGTVAAGVSAAQANISSTKLYPNPVSDMANVELNLKASSDVKVILSDLLGKEVMTIATGTMSSLSESFSVANLNKGIYTVNYFINGSAAKAELLMVK